MESDTKCSVGELTSTVCHKFTYVSKKGIENVADLAEDDRILLKMRTAATELLHTVCLHHKNVFLEKFEFLYGRVCCNPPPLKKHHKIIKNKSLRPVDVGESVFLSKNGFEVKPGQKLCSQCRCKLQEFKATTVNVAAGGAACNSEPVDMDFSLTDESASLKKVETIKQLNYSLIGIGSTPLKLHALGEHSKEAYGKDKLERFEVNVRNKLQKVLDIDIPESNATLEKLLEEKAADLNKLVNFLRDQLKVIPRKKQIQLLTIPVSLSWTKKKIQETFDVTDYTVRQAQCIFKNKGFLAEPDPICGKKLKLDVINLVSNFFESDEQSRVMPGMKDVVSIGKKEHRRKRLILGNLRELYSNFKSGHPDVKIGFSKFCSLRPKWCILAGASGTHSVCVCTIHQNVVLLLHAACIEESYKDIMKLLLCEDTKRECFLRLCADCPPKENLVGYLVSRFTDYDETDIIEFSQWVSTDRTQMIKCTTSLDEFIDDLAIKIEKLIPHSFIAKSQSSFLKKLKECVASDKAIILMDFSENYSFTIQDEAQGYHWTSDSCTVHPVVVYCKSLEGEKIISSHCAISDDLKHDVNFVYKIQETVVNFLKENFPHIREIHYFSDGCAAQYKNKFNFLNLCLHEEDFDLKAQWSFSATSHGKSECDGIGGTAKRLARRESLQRPLDGQITTTHDFFNFCSKTITKINFHLIDKKAVDSTRSTLENRFKDVLTLPGTRSFHNFKPIGSAGEIEARRISEDDIPSLKFNLKSCRNRSFVTSGDMYNMCYIACKYENFWYFAMVNTVNKDEEYAAVRFLNPHGPSPSFTWQLGRKLRTIPIPHVLAVVAPPTTTTGRTFHFPKDCMALMQEKMEHLESILRKRN